MISKKEPACIDSILSFWFGPLCRFDSIPLQKKKLWFTASASFDRQIKIRFEKWVWLASQNHLESWKETPRGRLALIILLDQFTRNLYRDSDQAFAQDSKALKLCLEGLRQKQDLSLKLTERWFFYMPLMHAENKRLQKKSITLFKSLVEKASKSARPHFEQTYDFAFQHAQVIQRFGRFPHRNEILQRKSTRREETYLRQGQMPF